mmetsp:Transcript_14392/g.31289  ORF Transcript_14392/g.31289 Transcript_14392/m.31289 type:complete len:107 (+) Transcript_14392:320-640(+)|eukprot:CAMPEP_0172549568 /NCGR_PEP_ID=MMETSP1067-20121228/18602_1 /TAXON_ID=265564 ORGANISM="Thalassiosira punctigera, Strain Tpunct2005C2" /NCGR_SAMPLE_ID=MMETSP1067 /ASSEMBLY_ACC=CAM_ASM_000444 /LENGTH=106 /DNA_ID=CAMNT_0013336961 /DNA_START=271 /DNA_END=591 /DNA_ORIENTATION=-
MTWNQHCFRTKTICTRTQNQSSMATPSFAPRRQLSTKQPSKSPPSTLWRTLKAPALFGVGLYLGLMMFGEHQETKQGSSYFEGLRGMFWGSSGDERGHINRDEGKR